jgi:Protein of unknown function (DUF1403)
VIRQTTPLAAIATSAARCMTLFGEQDRRAAEILSYMMADLALAEVMNWPVALPLLMSAANQPLLRPGAEQRRILPDDSAFAQHVPALLCHAAIAAQTRAVDLQRKALALIPVAASLRTKGGAAGLAVVLGDDAIAPWMLHKASATSGSGRAVGSDRAGRRFLETLTERKVLRELTQRAIFRLYGV